MQVGKSTKYSHLVNLCVKYLADFSAETLQDTMQLNEIFKALKEVTENQ